MALVALPLLLIVWPRFGQICLAGFSLFFLALFFDCLRQTRSLVVAFWALPAALVQLTGYGFGFLKAYLSR
jgi:hypothetical protein